MISIITADPLSDHYLKFQAMILSEWGQVDQLPVAYAPYPLPMPLLALDGQELVGGLSFIHYKHPTKASQVLWINTVYVDARSRGKGIASSLISRAIDVLWDLAEEEVFVYTDKPSLYIKLGWKVLSLEETHYILTFEVVNKSS